MVHRPSAFIVAVAAFAIVIALAVLVSASVTDAFDRPIVEAIRTPGLSGVLTPLGPITHDPLPGDCGAVPATVLSSERSPVMMLNESAG